MSGGWKASKPMFRGPSLSSKCWLLTIQPPDVAASHFIEFSCRESFKLCVCVCVCVCVGVCGLL